MSDSWAKRIQPILDSPGFEHSNWVWDPFLEKYPRLTPEQRVEVEDALISCSFDTNDKEVAIKALGIAEALCNAKLASKRFAEKMQDELRKQSALLLRDQAAARYYIFAFSTFDVKEAIPNIKAIMHPMMEGSPQTPIYLNERSHRELFRACCIALLQLQDSEAKSLFAFFLVNDLHMMVVDPNRAMWGLTDLASFWEIVGISGLREIAELLGNWQKEYLVAVLPQLRERIEQMRYRSGKERQDALKLVEDLENRAMRN